MSENRACQPAGASGIQLIGQREHSVLTTAPRAAYDGYKRHRTRNKVFNTFSGEGRASLA